MSRKKPAASEPQPQSEATADAPKPLKSFLVKVEGDPFGSLRLTVPAEDADAAKQRVVDDFLSKMTVEG